VNTGGLLRYRVGMTRADWAILLAVVAIVLVALILLGAIG
jgi:hypothetical protein